MSFKNGTEGVIYSYAATVNPLEDENRTLRDTVSHLKEELDKFKKSPLMVCSVKDIIGEETMLMLPNGSEFLVNKTKECGELRPGDSVLVEQKNLMIVKKIPKAKHFAVEVFVIVEKPTITWSDIGGMKEQINEVQEIIELPLKKPELFKEIGITPPKGILLHGPPGTGKTLLAKAVANSTNSTFIEVVASELVQKFIGEGAKLVKEIFQLAREKAPSIVFIVEIDALAAKRIDIGTSGEREVQRTFMQLLAELDGFKPLDNVKIIGATNRKDILDPAILRPGRLDRLVACPIPDTETRHHIFKIHSSAMSLKQINPQDIISRMDSFSGADIKAACTEAGYFAIRNNRKHITRPDFLSAIEKIKRGEKEDTDYQEMFV